MPSRSLPAICLGSLVTFCMYGYQFGRGNHASYLVDSLRRARPELLGNDWFATQTLQYHTVFSHATAFLMRLGIERPVFAIIYAALILLFHYAWWRIVRHLGGRYGAYLVSVVLYYLSAAGTGLGMYQFFQDASVLPSNIANVAMLWGICLWLEGKFSWSGACFGVAGLFHLNHALVGSVLWLTACALTRPGEKSLRPFIAGTAFALIPSLLNIAMAARLKLARSGAMSLDEFVQLYVRIRHSHHYDPSTWPIGIWIVFLWTLLAGLMLLRGSARRIIVFFAALIGVALIGAGFWFVSETLIQMSLYRFSIYIQLLGCAAAGVWIDQYLRSRRSIAVAGAFACAAIIGICLLRGPYAGFFRVPGDDENYVALCRWIQRNTLADAIFIVPPAEESMRLIGQRAIIVNFKCVPQLSAELVEWRRRMCDVLNSPNLDDLPRRYPDTLAALRQRYGALSGEELLALSGKYHADYVVALHPIPEWESRRVQTGADGPYMLYYVAH